MRKLASDNNGSAIPVLLFLITIFSCGALYSLFFVEIAYPTLAVFVPASDSKTFIMMCMYAIPLFVIVVGIIALMIAGLKRSGGVVYQ